MLKGDMITFGWSGVVSRFCKRRTPSFWMAAEMAWLDCWLLPATRQSFCGPSSVDSTVAWALWFVSISGSVAVASGCFALSFLNVYRQKTEEKNHFQAEWRIIENGLGEARNNHCSCIMSRLKTLLMVSIFCSDLDGAAGQQGNERHQRDGLISCHFTILHTRKRHKLTMGANITWYISIMSPGIYLSALHWVPGCKDRSTGVLEEGPCPCSVNCEKRNLSWNN